MITVYINNENDEENHDDDNDKDQNDLAEVWLICFFGSWKRWWFFFLSFLLTEANLIRTVRDHPVLYLLCIQFLLLWLGSLFVFHHWQAKIYIIWWSGWNQQPGSWRHKEKRRKFYVFFQKKKKKSYIIT